MLDEFKTDILGSLSEQLDTLKIHNKQKAEAEALAIFCPRCTKSNPRNECPLNSIEVCSVCEENHSIDKCPSFPDLKAIY